MSFENLNKDQSEVVSLLEGPILVLAGAGAGKTKTITYRILNLIKNGVSPENILAITFTNKAAQEMRERVNKLLEEDASVNRPISRDFYYNRPFVSTFHSLCVRIIKDNISLISSDRHFSIYDRSDSKRLIKEAMHSLNYDNKEIEPGKILSIISREKGNALTASEYSSRQAGDFFGDMVSKVWTKYDELLRKENAFDFDDLLLVALNLLKNNSEVLNNYRNLWKYIHIDEYQDTNTVQYELSKLLAHEHKNICAVGDIDQNIYSWRGANIRNILNFEKDYPESHVVVLEQNYRSTQTILAVANRIIEKNEMRRKKNLFTENGVGDKVTIFEALDEMNEAQYVAEKIKNLNKQGIQLSDIAVLYRANFQSRALEEACLRNGVSYQVVGTRFYDRKEIKDVISFIRFSLNQESVSDLTRIINIPARGIGKVTLLKIIEKKEDGLPIKTKEKIYNFRKMIEKIKHSALNDRPSETVNMVVEVTGLGEAFHKSEEDIERIENLKELVALAKRYDHMNEEEGIDNFLSDVALASDQDALKEAESVRLMTVHASKGLEFQTVFITGLEEGLFPSDKDRNENVTREEAEEERRLFYVAVTRAKKKLFLTYAQSRTIFGSRGINIPSEFIFDIPDEHVEKDYLDYIPRHKPLLDIEF